MSDFPKGGDTAVTRAWLDKKGFLGIFIGWKADVIMGQDKADILSAVTGENGLKLWGFLNTARRTATSNIYFLPSIPFDLTGSTGSVMQQSTTQAVPHQQNTREEEECGF
jgi:hypothetical protein